MFRFNPHRRNPVGDIVLARHHAVRGHVRADGARAHIHDSRVRSGVQGRHQLGDRANHTPRPVRHVFRYVKRPTSGCTPVDVNSCFYHNDFQVSSFRPYVNWNGTPYSWRWEASTRLCCLAVS